MKVGIIAPSYRPEISEIEPSLDLLEAVGYELVWGNEALNSPPRYTSPFERIEQRADEFIEMWQREDIDVIFAVDGGAGCCYLAPLVCKAIAEYGGNPKALLGCSDINFIQYAIITDDPTHCQAWIAPNLWVEDIAQLKECLVWLPSIVEAMRKGEIAHGSISARVDVFEPGSVSGMLYPGTLSCLIHLAGTPYAPNFLANDSIILAEEHSDITPGQYEYLLWERTQHLYLTGHWSALSGLVIGDVEHEGPYETPEDMFPSYQETIIRSLVKQQYPENLPIPICSGFPFGFDRVQRPIPIGVQATLVIENGRAELAW